jgi:hypothetical protein
VGSAFRRIEPTEAGSDADLYDRREVRMAIDNQDVRWFVALGVLMLLVFAYIYMPRYDVRTVGDSGSVTIVVIDRWTGRIQRAVYDEGGKLHVSDVYVPF